MALHGKIMFISVHGDPLSRLGGIQSGGQNVYVKELVRALDSMGMRVEVFTHWSDESLPQTETLGRNSRVIRLAAGCKGFLSKHKMFGMLPIFLRDLSKYLKNPRQYAVIHSNYWLSGWVGLKLQRALGIPRVHTSHSLGIVRKDALAVEGREPLALRLRVEKELLQKADCVIATTPLEKEIINERYCVPAAGIRVIPCGVNTELFGPTKKHEFDRTLSNQERKTVLFVGRFEENKGLEILLKSFCILKENYPQTASSSRLVIVGGDCLEKSPSSLSAEKKKYLEFISKNRISDLVIFAGPQKHEFLPAWYSNATVTAVPSFYESFGLVAVEAMACGCPVIASKTGGLQFSVLQGKTGLLVEPKNPEELASAINYLLTNEEVRKKMSREAAFHGKRFDWKTIVSKMVNVYEGVTGWQKEYTVRSPNTFWQQI